MFGSHKFKAQEISQITKIFHLKTLMQVSFELSDKMHVVSSNEHIIHINQDCNVTLSCGLDEQAIICLRLKKFKGH